MFIQPARDLFPPENRFAAVQVQNFLRVPPKKGVDKRQCV